MKEKLSFWRPHPFLFGDQGWQPAVLFTRKYVEALWIMKFLALMIISLGHGILDFVPKGRLN